MANSEPARELILQMLHTRMAFRQTIQRVLKAGDIDMTFEMLQVMHCLWKNQGISQQSLAEQTAKDKACLTNLMNNLEKKGYVYRKEDTNDRRNKLVYLTPEGEALKVQIRPILNLVYANAEEILSTERTAKILSELKTVQNVLEGF